MISVRTLDFSVSLFGTLIFWRGRRTACCALLQPIYGDSRGIAHDKAGNVWQYILIDTLVERGLGIV